MKKKKCDICGNKDSVKSNNNWTVCGLNPTTHNEIAKYAMGLIEDCPHYAQKQKD